MAESETNATPWHLWLVGVIATLFNILGAYDYVKTKTGDEQYLKEVAELTQEQIDFVANLPVWTTSLWAVGVWGGLLGGFFLLLKKSISVQAFLASFIASAAYMSYLYIFADGAVLADQAVFAVIIIVLEYAFFRYARVMKQKGFLG